MLWYLLRRIGAAVVALWLTSLIVFLGSQALPGDPATILAGDQGGPEAVAQIRVKYGLDQPLPVQYLRWVWLALHGDLGQSIHSGLSVSDMVSQRIGITLYLAALSVGVAALIGIPLGVLVAVKRGKLADYIGNAIGLIGLSVAPFWLGLVLILVFAVQLGWLPASGYVPFLEDPVESLRRMVMPVIVIALSFTAIIMRQMRSSTLDVLDSDYIKVARTKGLSERRIIVRHAVRNSLTTVVTVIGLQFGAIIAGAVVVEQVFILPGYGRMMLEAVFTRDYPVIQGAVLVGAVAFIVINLSLDVLYAFLNPRIRTS